MNKGDFITYISEKHSISKVEAEKVIDMFTSLSYIVTYFEACKRCFILCFFLQAIKT